MAENIEFIQRHRREKQFRMPAAHFHEKHELYYLEHGKTKYFIGSEIYILSPGDFIFVPRNEFHKTDSEDAVDVERLLLTFDDEFAGEEYKEYIDDLIVHKHIRIPREHLSKLKDVMNKIEYEDRTKAENYEEMEKMYLRQLLILIKRYKQKPSRKNLTDSYRIINDAARYISANCGEELSLLVLSKKYALSSYYFSKLFREVTGVGLNEYINISRISMAQKLLSSTAVSVTEAAEKCGFNDSNYFAQVFKKLTGITPKKYSMQFSR